MARSGLLHGGEASFFDIAAARSVADIRPQLLEQGAHTRSLSIRGVARFCDTRPPEAPDAIAKAHALFQRYLDSTCW
jgi:hypothetical protein